MRVLKSLAVLAVGVLITACTPSLHPLFTEKDLVFEPSLLGRWVMEDEELNQTEWTFTDAGGKSYGLVHLEDDEAGRFEARLLKLGRHWFLDIYPQEPEGENGFYKLHLVRAHTFVRITLEDEVLSVSMLDQEWLENAVENGDLAIAHESINGGFLLTAPTTELQQFMLEITDNPKAFPEASIFRRSE